ncbi:MAG: DUF4149 domain-containing protein [Nitrospirae bacterium]|nr:DUF4149 domain-containing protein [Nitrospirota bacterium]
MEVLALAVWVGGLVSIIAAVIPAVFNTIGMERGGRMLTRMFQGYDRLALVAAGFILVGTLVRVYAAGPWQQQIGTGELALLATMVVIATVLACWLTPETARLQEIAFGAKDDAKRIAYDNFFAYHRVARALYIINLGLGITLLCVKVKKWVR